MRMAEAISRLRAPRRRPRNRHITGNQQFPRNSAKYDNFCFSIFVHFTDIFQLFSADLRLMRDQLLSFALRPTYTVPQSRDAIMLFGMLRGGGGGWVQGT